MRPCHQVSRELMFELRCVLYRENVGEAVAPQTQRAAQEKYQQPSITHPSHSQHSRNAPHKQNPAQCTHANTY